METKLSVEYTLEIYEKSFTNDPTVVFQSSTPFMAFHKGDYIHPGLWDNQVDARPGAWFEIKDVVHRVWEIEGSHVGHQIGLCIVEKDRPK